MSEPLRSRLSLLLTLVLAVFVVVMLVTAEPAAVDRAERIGSLVRCPVCNGESIADSPAPLARDMMAVVEEGIEAGLDDEQIIDGLLTAYTNSQRLDPELSPATLALWLAPGSALVVGVILAGSRVRSRPGRPDEERRGLPDSMAEET